MLNDFVELYVDEALALPADQLQDKSKSKVGYSLLHALVASTRDRTLIRDQLVAMLLASRVR